MLLRLRCFYHLRKARVPTEVDKAYLAYEKNLRKARKAIHIESVEYLEKIEDAYLDRHKEMIREQHFEYQCSFRKQIFTDAFRLQQNQLKWKERDAEYNSTLTKHLHEQDVKKINRSRILKIMEHESNNYWFNSQNVETRLKEESLFPQYIASSEYYYKLFAEALAYELGDFNELHMVSSNEEIIREKNKYLIPIYLKLRNKIKEFKRDDEKEARQKASFDINLIRDNAKLSPEEAKELQDRINQQLEAKIQEIKTKKQVGGKVEQLKMRVKQIISIFKTWKEYTNVLALTSAQILKNRSDVSNQMEIQKVEKEVLKNLTSKMNETFLDSVEEDTEEVQMTFEEYLAKINQDRKEKDIPSSGNVSIDELETLLSSTETDSVGEEGLRLKSEKISELGELTQEMSASEAEEQTERQAEDSNEELNPLFMSPKETTASVEVLKESFKSDKQMLTLLNQLGQIDVRYPLLFETIWKSSQ